jgi:diguanylate cyclase (GGDEF)-like protein
VDYFKQINDRYGHQSGDAVLKHVGRLLRNRLRKSDIVARYGGEEFLIVLPDTDAANTLLVAGALRQLVALSPARPTGPELFISASFGVAMATPPEDIPTKEIIGRADAALYRSKASGRDRVTAWEAPPDDAAALAAAGAAVADTPQ